MELYWTKRFLFFLNLLLFLYSAPHLATPSHIQPSLEKSPRGHPWVFTPVAQWLVVWTWSQTGRGLPRNWYVTVGNLLNSASASVSPSIKHDNNTPRRGTARITCDSVGSPVTLSETWYVLIRSRLLLLPVFYIQVVTNSCWFYLLNSSWMFLSVPSFLLLPHVRPLCPGYCSGVPPSSSNPSCGYPSDFTRMFIGPCCFPACCPPETLRVTSEFLNMQRGFCFFINLGFVPFWWDISSIYCLYK